MTDTEAEAMLVQLTKHYRQPVLPLSRVCEALKSWAKCIRANQKPPLILEGRGAEGQHGNRYADVLNKIALDVEKSGLLYRLLFLGEKVRTRMCPTHKGHMSTSIWCNVSDETCECQGSGWLPNGPDDV